MVSEYRSKSLTERHLHTMALNQSARLDLLGELKLADVTDRIRFATETLYQELIDAESVFPNAAALLRLAGSVLIEQHDEWEAGERRYFSEASMLELATMNNPIESPDEEVILPELAAAQLKQLTRTVSRNSTTQRDVTHAASCGPLAGPDWLRRSEGLGVPVGEGSASASPHPFGDCRSSTRWGPAFICAISEHPRPAERARMRRAGADAPSGRGCAERARMRRAGADALAAAIRR